MPTRVIPFVKVLVHAVCVWPFVWLLLQYRSGALMLQADPVNYITHATGNLALWMLLASLVVTPLRRLHPRLSNLIRLRRLLGLYAFFYATLHLATYVFLFSGYDVASAWTGLKSGHAGVLWSQWKAIWPDVLDDLKKRRFIQVGLLSWTILLALAFTSPTAALRRMGGKRWQRLHRLVYLAAIAACVHYWWLVKAGVRSPLPDSLILAVLFLARIGWVVWQRQRRLVPASGRPAVRQAPGSGI